MLADITALKHHLRIATSNVSEDFQLNQALRWADAAIKAELHRPNLDVPQTYVDYYDGTNTPLIVLRQCPVTSVASVYLDRSGYWNQGAGAYAATTQLTAGVDYALRPDAPDGVTSLAGLLVRVNGVWPPVSLRVRGLLAAYLTDSYGSIQVTYTAGYAIVPPDLEMAVCLVAAGIRQTRGTGAPINSENWDGYSYKTVATVDPLAIVRPILAKYRRLTVGS
jgi:hypothetical protein